ncbi:MAG: cation:proton antiporter [Deltaproteobacteria bacterium]|nr:cation:proton antiporter [Deltaproteobacteria bacterium]
MHSPPGAIGRKIDSKDKVACSDSLYHCRYFYWAFSPKPYKSSAHSIGLISNIALGIIAFSLGESFLFSSFKEIGRAVFYISIAAALLPAILVTIGLYFLFKQPLSIALLFGAISSATAPAATLMVVREYKAKGNLTNTLLGVVAIDDAWCLIIFALAFAFSRDILQSEAVNPSWLKVIYPFVKEICLVVILGSASALLCNFISRYIKLKSDLLIYILGFLLLNTGLAIYCHLSLLLTNIVFGAVLVNLNPTSFKFFDLIKSIDAPLYLMFFILAGANLKISLLQGTLLMVTSFIILRSLGKLAGAYLGGYLLALIVKEAFPQVGSILFPTIIAATVFYEIVGPIFTRYALVAAKEAQQI